MGVALSPVTVPEDGQMEIGMVLSEIGITVFRAYADLVAAGLQAADAGFAAATDMIAQYGKAAVFREQTKGKPDTGCAAAVLVVQGLLTRIG